MIEMSKTFEKFQLVFNFVLFFTLKLLFSIHEKYKLAKIWGGAATFNLLPLSFGNSFGYIIITGLLPLRITIIAMIT